MDHHLSAPSGPIEDDDLRAYLAETLSSEESARIEKALRDSAELRDRLEEVRQNRGEAGLHSLGAIWRRARLTCASRQQLGSLLLEALDPDLSDYLTFHIEIVGCPYCQANLADLRLKNEAAAPAARHRHARILNSSKHLLEGGQ